LFKRNKTFIEQRENTEKTKFDDENGNENDGTPMMMMRD
jgi:hypothetical protein